MCNFYHDLDLLQEDTVFYRHRQSSYRKTQIFYRKVQKFYRKSCVLQETSCRRLRQPKFVSNEDLATEEWFECMHATDGTPEHRHYRPTPSSSPCKPRYLQQHNKVISSREETSVKEKSSTESHTTSTLCIRSTGIVKGEPGPPAYSMHTRRKDCDKTPRGDPAAVQPARVKTVHSTAI